MFPEAVLAPDSAVMVDYLFHDLITDYTRQGRLAEIISSTAERGYIAVQLRENTVPASVAASILEDISRSLEFPLVFFRAGSAPRHDSLVYYQNIAGLMNVSTIIFEDDHVWKTVALISRAKLVISTSLHVRIMAFIHNRPRLTICSSHKHNAFIHLWDAPDSPRCISKDSTHWLLFAKEAMLASQKLTQRFVNLTVATYLDTFDTWSALLRDVN